MQLPQLNIHLYAPARLEQEQAKAQAASESLADWPVAPFATSFEEAGQRLESLARLYFEMDGSFVWVGDAPVPWQLDGMLYDHAGRLQRVELKGCCPLNNWRELLNALGVDSRGVVAHHVDAQRWSRGQELELLWEPSGA